jgi:hypothetical protein
MCLKFERTQMTLFYVAPLPPFVYPTHHNTTQYYSLTHSLCMVQRQRKIPPQPWQKKLRIVTYVSLVVVGYYAFFLSDLRTFSPSQRTVCFIFLVVVSNYDILSLFDCEEGFLVDVLVFFLWCVVQLVDNSFFFT